MNLLDGVTATTAELNILDGVTSTFSELNILDGVTATTAELNILDGVTASTAEINILDGVTATTAELNILDGVEGLASQAEAQAGTNNTKLMTPLRTDETITAKIGTANSSPVKTALNAANDPPIYACRAWVQFDGTTSPGTIAGSGNVTSVTKNSTGLYTINFTTAMPDANYSVQVTSKDPNTGSGGGHTQEVRAVAAGTCQIRLARGGDNSSEDSDLICVSVFR